MAISDMERGVGGRIEAAFEAAKAKGEAAFVTFITAGYPTAEGRFWILLIGSLIDSRILWIQNSFHSMRFMIHFRYTGYSSRHARRRCCSY